VPTPEPERSKPETATVRGKRPGSFDSRVVRQDTLDKMPELEAAAAVDRGQYLQGRQVDGDADRRGTVLCPHALHQAEAG
jgi:hypothetical protein